MQPAKYIGSNRQLFIDHELIESLDDVELVTNQPQKRGAIVGQDLPWRSKLVGYFGTVLEDGGVYKMWTNCGEGDVGLGPECGYGINYGKKRYVQYLTSTDGFHWTSPSLGVIDFKGTKSNNLVMNDDNMEGTVFIDPNAPADKRYKYLGYMSNRGLFLHDSPDGIHWRLSTDRLLNHQFDTQNVAFWDASIGKYVCYFRGWETAPPNPDDNSELAKIARNVVRVEVDDFQELKSLQGPTQEGKPLKFIDALPPIMRCDELDPVDTDIYTNAVVKYPLAEDVYLSFPALYGKNYDVPNVKNNGVLEVQMAVSRDGVEWNRIRKPYFPTGPVGEIDSASTYFYTGMLVKETEILQYYWGSSYTHGGLDTYAQWEGVNRNAIFVLSQRIDGFTSMDAAYTGGTLLTKPFVFEGDRLVLNLNTAATGTTTVAVLDESGQEIEGFTLGDCDRIKGNDINKVVSWGGNASVSSLSGRVIRLKFAMNNTKLFSLRFER